MRRETNLPYDAFLVSKIVKEIDTPTYLTGIHLGTKGVIVLSLKKVELVLDMRVWPHVHISSNYIFADENPTPFVSLMRARLKGAVLVKVEQLNFDRVIKFSFEVKNLIGNVENFELYHEVTGAFGNLILVKNGICVGTFKDVISPKRVIIKGAPYKPPEENRIDPHEVGVSTFENSAEKLNVFLVKNIRGLSKKDTLEITRRAEISFDTRLDSLTFEERQRILKVIEEILNESDKKGAYVLIKENIPQDVYAFKPYGESKYFESACEAIEYFLSGRKRHNVMESRKDRLKKFVDRLTSKTDHTIDKVSKEVLKAQGADEFRKYGQLLISNLYSLPKRAKKVELTDWESGEKISIILDSKIDISKNAQHFFDLYNHLKRKLEGAQKRQKILKKRLLYFEQLKDEIENASEISELIELETELHLGGFLAKKKKIKKRKRIHESKPLEVEYKGFKMLIGKNNVQNDRITTKMASHDDIWFHTREVPGAHVVMITAGRDPSQDVIEMAASLAAGHSRYKDAAWVDVDYTKIKNVSKPKGSKPGFVLYKKFKTIRVKPKR